MAQWLLFHWPVAHRSHPFKQLDKHLQVVIWPCLPYFGVGQEGGQGWTRCSLLQQLCQVSSIRSLRCYHSLHRLVLVFLQAAESAMLGLQQLHKLRDHLQQQRGFHLRRLVCPGFRRRNVTHHDTPETTDKQDTRTYGNSPFYTGERGRERERAKLKNNQNLQASPSRNPVLKEYTQIWNAKEIILPQCLQYRYTFFFSG